MKKVEKKPIKKAKGEKDEKKGRLSRYSKIESNLDLFKVVKNLKKGKSVARTAKSLTGDDYVGITTRKKTVELYKKIAAIQFSKSPVNHRKFEKLTFTRV